MPPDLDTETLRRWRWSFAGNGRSGDVPPANPAILSHCTTAILQREVAGGCSLPPQLPQ